MVYLFIQLGSPLSEGIKENEVALNSFQRTTGNFTLQMEVDVAVFISDASVALAGLTISLDFLQKKAGMPKLEIKVDELSESFKKQFSNQIFFKNQKIVMDWNGQKFDMAVDGLDHANIGVEKTSGSSNKGQITQVTQLTWKKHAGSTSPIIFVGQSAGTARNDSLFKEEFNFESLGIGGLDAQFSTMFRRAFASRIFPGLYKDLGINHVRGILLYGPPGCGKTLIARQIGKVLNAREPKIVNGPEILDKYVGGSEEKIRELFADAEKEQAEMGDASMLHIIIFDEMDAIMKKRGSSRDSTGVGDSVVNQLLSKIDGVTGLNNILIIGMTNRKDMIDEAILRPGRLSVHIEISLPNVDGRSQIIRIHTSKFIKEKRMKPECQEMLPTLAEVTKNFTGAEIEGLIGGAFNFAVSRNVDPTNIKTANANNVVIEWRDFERALDETKPAFGAKEQEEIKGLARNGICNYGDAYDIMWKTLQRLVNQTRTSQRTPLMSVLLEGSVKVGKTAIAATLCSESDFPFIRMISGTSMIGYSESQKCEHILSTFKDSYKSALSIIFIDDIERIIEYTPSGPRFLNSVLQTLLLLIRQTPPSPPKIAGLTQPDPRLLVIATTSISTLLEDLQLVDAFEIKMHVSQLQQPSEISRIIETYAPEMTASDIRKIASSITKPIGVKQLMMILEMARVEDIGQISVERFMECLTTIGY